MTTTQLIAQVWILIPVALLFVAGIALTLQSGHVRLGTTTGVRQMMGNLTSTVLMLGLCVALALVAQSAVGYKVGASW